MVRPIARKVLNAEYAALRAPLAALDEKVVSKLPPRSRVRRTVEQGIDTLDAVAGRVLKTTKAKPPAPSPPTKVPAAKKAPAQKTAAKKTAAKKAPAKKTPAKKTPAKKTPAKKTPAKKTAAKTTAR